MTSFPNSPKLLKGGSVLIDPATSLVSRIIALQYNPDSISRTLQVQSAGEESGDSEATWLKGPLAETITIEAEIDAIDLRHMLQGTLETELTPLLNNAGLAPSLVEGGALPRISISGVQLPSNNPTRIGQQIPQSVYGAIGHE